MFAVGNRGGNINQNKRENRMNNGNTMTAGPLTFEKEQLPDGSDMGVVLFDKERAVECLARNVEQNRNIRKTHVKRLAGDMENERWHFTGVPVVFDSRGYLIDGQHRMAAIIQADITVPLVVVVTTGEKTMHVMDCGAKRSGADVLTFEGFTYAAKRAALLPMLSAYYSNSQRLPRKWNATNAELPALAARFTDADASLAEASKIGTDRSLNIAPTSIAFAHYILSKKDAERATEFFNRFHDGAELEKGDPVLALRRSLVFTRDGRNTPVWVGAVKIVKAWNFRATGRQVAKINVKDDAEFPLVK